MAVSKILIDGVGIDLSTDTVASANDIATGKVGHLNDGTVVTGTHSGSSYAFIRTTYPSGSTCTCTDGTTTLTAEDTSGYFVFSIPNSATWTISCTDGSETASATITITYEGQSESTELVYRCPAEYQEVEYIESHGTEYIDTNIPINSINIDISLDYALTKISFSAAGTPFFGAYSANGGLAVLFTPTGFSLYQPHRNVAITNDTSKHNISVISKDILYDGVSKGTFNPADTSNITLLINHTMDSAGALYGQTPASVRWYAVKIWKDSSLLRNYIPCYRKSDSVVGLWDTVSKTFYTNSGTGAFDIGKPIGVLPSIYQEVEYLQSSGTQYVMTDVVPTNNIKIVSDIMALHSITTGNDVFSIGAIYQNSQRCYIPYLYNDGSGNKYSINYGTINSSHTRSVTVNPNVKYRFNVHYTTSTQKILVDANVLHNASVSTSISITNKLPLFARTENGSVVSKYYSRIYSCTIYLDGILSAIFIPCYRKSDNVAGFYETINGVFYENEGTGTFIVGGDVT